MTSLDHIQKVERAIEQSKCNLRALRAKRWTHKNYVYSNGEENHTAQPDLIRIELDKKINHFEAKLHADRVKLSGLINLYYNLTPSHQSQNQLNNLKN